jgi:mannose-1-phosphate guanylyltransferase/mannose-6-phosphate isomerase
MAGGSGTRLWPLSRRDRPKQLLPLTGDRTLLAETFARIGEANRWMVVGESYADLCAQEVPAAHCLREPMGRNTAAAIALAAHAIDDPGAVMVVSPADHFVRDVGAFRDALQRAATLAAEGWIATLGVRPTRPETGYGYIQRGEPLGVGAFTVARFCEKPAAATAAAFVAAGTYDWNAGIFVLRCDTYWQELSWQLPDTYRAFRRLPEISLRACYESIASVSVDYGIMEGARKVAVVPVDCGWSDIGSLASLADLGTDAQGNYRRGEVTLVDSRGCVAIGGDEPLVLMGCTDLMVVRTAHATFVAPKSQAQAVRELVATLPEAMR